jgi:hypothetical protein
MPLQFCGVVTVNAFLLTVKAVPMHAIKTQVE